ncbi:MAG: NPCBM/NEW2 domain-containing protein [Armatimonadota bacterium]
MPLFTRSFWSLIALLLFLSGAMGNAQAQQVKEKVIDKEMLVSSDRLDDFCGRCTIGGLVYDSNFTVVHWYQNGPHWAVLDVRGWDHFTASVGFPDDGNRKWDRQETVTIEVDGIERWKQKVSFGEKAYTFDIPITGARSLRITISNGPIALAEAKVTRGKPVPSYLLAQTVQLLIDLRTSAAQSKSDAIVKYIDQRLEAMGIYVTVDQHGVTTWHMI